MMMINKVESRQLNNIDLKNTNLKIKEMFRMKKLLTIAITILVVGAIFTGCGTTTAAKKATAAQAQATAEKQGATDIEKAKPEIDKIVNTTIDLCYNLTSVNVDANQDKAKGIAVEGYKLFPDSGVKFIKNGGQEKLVSTDNLNVELKDVITDKTTGKKYAGAIATAVVAYAENGVAKKDNVTITILFDIKTNTWKLAEIVEVTQK